MKGKQGPSTPRSGKAPPHGMYNTCSSPMGPCLHGTHTNPADPVSFIGPSFCNPRFAVLKVPCNTHLYNGDDPVDVFRSLQKESRKFCFLFDKHFR